MRKLGKGLDAIIGGGLDAGEKEAGEDRNSEPAPEKRENVGRDVKREAGEAEAIDPSVLEKVVDEALKNPRVTTWSPKAAAVLRYLRKTIPEFSVSREAGELLEGAIREKYPGLWEEVEKAIEERK